MSMGGLLLLLFAGAVQSQPTPRPVTAVPDVLRADYLQQALVVEHALRRQDATAAAMRAFCAANVAELRTSVNELGDQVFLCVPAKEAK